LKCLLTNKLLRGLFPGCYAVTPFSAQLWKFKLPFSPFLYYQKQDHVPKRHRPFILRSVFIQILIVRKIKHSFVYPQDFLQGQQNLLSRRCFATFALSSIRNIYPRIRSIFFSLARLLDSFQKSSGLMLTLGIKLYSCMSLVQSVLSKSYIRATVGLISATKTPHFMIS